MANPVNPTQPFNWPQKAAIDQIQQVKAAGISPTAITTNQQNPGVQGVPKPVSNVSLSKKILNSTQTQVTVSFTRDTSDAYFVQAKVYIRFGNSSIPALVSEGATSPISFVINKNSNPATIIVVSSGNWGSTSISSSPSASILLTGATPVLLAQAGSIGGSGPSTVDFGSITSGYNTLATMTVGSGSSIIYAGTGLIDANTIGGINVDGNTPSHEGQVLISQPGDTAAVWADPQVQGLYAAGASISSPPLYTAPTTIQPILIGGSDYAGTPLLQNIKVDASGNIYIGNSTLAVTQSTSPWVVSGTVTADQGGSWTVAATQSGTWNIGTLTSITNPVTVNQGTSPWITNIEASGTPLSATLYGSPAVEALNVYLVNPATIPSTISVTQGTSPWVVSLASTTITGTVAVTQSGAWTVASTQSGSWYSRTEDGSGNAINSTTEGSPATTGLNVHVQNASPIPVSGTLTVSGTVAVTQSTSPWVVDASGYTVPVSGTFWQAIQPVSGTVAATQSGTWTVQQGSAPWSVSQSGTWNIGTVTSITDPVAVTGTFWQTTQPVSGTVTVDQGTNPWTSNIEASGVPLTATLYGSPAVEALNVYVVNPSGGGGGSVTQGTVPWVTEDVAAEASLASLASTVIETGSPAAPALNVFVTNPTSSTIAPIASTGNVPALVPVSTSSVQILASNASRKGCNLTNMSDSTISLAFGSATAVLFSGVVLGPGGTFWMDLQDFTTAAINAIASDTEGNVAVQEFD